MEKLVKISSLFNVTYGVNLELNKLEVCDYDSDNAIRFVSRTKENNGVSAFVKKLSNIEPNPGKTISVAGGGSYVLASFIQSEPYYSGRDVFILTPINPMSEEELIYFCMCISNNRYKYNYGRQANKTLRDILIPEKMPKAFQKIDTKGLSTFKRKSVLGKKVNLNSKEWEWFDVPTLFDISASSDDLIDNLTLGGKTPYVTSTEFNNGVTNFVEEPPTNKAKTITANRGGSVGYFFYQPIDYLATPVDVRILTPKFPINDYIGLFIATILKLEKFRFNYSRKMGTDRLEKLKIKLPAKNGVPDFDCMEQLIKSLPYSSSL